ncbi:MAG: flagellar hook-length control protein FliK [Propionivibrio sp.]
MSVTIVSALPSTNPMPQVGSTESMAGSDGSPASLGFADMLLGQKLKSILASTDQPITAEEPGNGLAQTETDTDRDDAAAILAALGLTAPPPSTNTPAAEHVTSAGAGRVGDANARLARVGGDMEQSKSQEATTENAASRLGAVPLSDDSPAKFAVPSAVVAETSSKTEPLPAAGDPQDKAVVMPTNLPTTTGQRETPLAVHAHVRDQSWSSEFSQKIVWLANNDKQSAQLTLNPPQMGPIEISLSVDKGSASAAFVSANPEVRDAIETALPRLREMFASAGIQLGQTNVSSESFRQQGESSAGNPARSQTQGDNAILAGGSGESLTARAFLGRAGNGLVDLFA